MIFGRGEKSSKIKGGKKTVRRPPFGKPRKKGSYAPESHKGGASGAPGAAESGFCCGLERSAFRMAEFRAERALGEGRLSTLYLGPPFLLKAPSCPST